MTIREQIRSAIDAATGPICDDCLTKQLGLKQRQQAYSRCTELAQAGAIGRGEGTCVLCGKVKKVNWRLGEAAPEQAAAGSAPAVAKAAPGQAEEGQPWYWEGNIQAQIVSFLVRQGYRILQVVRTSTREPGKDIVAVSPQGRELWVSVKGYPTPKASANTQARHWFAHAVFDLVLYRSQSPDVDLAIGLPDGYVTYQGLAERIGWLRQHLPCRIIWVNEAGDVRIE